MRHDDRLDALAGAVAYWVESMGRDEAHALKVHREALLDADLQKFMNGVLGLKPKNNNWMGR